jgi:hypothetical protein
MSLTVPGCCSQPRLGVCVCVGGGGVNACGCVFGGPSCWMEQQRHSARQRHRRCNALPCVQPHQSDAPASEGAAAISLGGASLLAEVPTGHAASCSRRVGGGWVGVCVGGAGWINPHATASNRARNPPGSTHSGMPQVWVMSPGAFQAGRTPFPLQCMCEAVRTVVPGVLSGGRQYSSTTCRGTALNMLEVSRAAVAGMRSNHRPRVSAWCPGLSWQALQGLSCCACMQRSCSQGGQHSNALPAAALLLHRACALPRAVKACNNPEDGMRVPEVGFGAQHGCMLGARPLVLCLLGRLVQQGTTVQHPWQSERCFGEATAGHSRHNAGRTVCAQPRQWRDRGHAVPVGRCLLVLGGAALCLRLGVRERPCVMTWCPLAAP